MQETGVQIACRDERPPSIELEQWDSTGGTEDKKAVIAWRKKVKWAAGKSCVPEVDNHREHVHCNVRYENHPEDSIFPADPSSENIVFPYRARIFQAAGRANRCRSTDQLSAMGA